MIRIENLHKKFRKNRVLQGIDLTFTPGRITALLGPNGSGKTTMIKCLLGMVIPDTGNMFLDGKSINGAYAFRDQTAYLPQIARFPENLRVRELFGMIQDIRGKAVSLEKLLGRFALHPYLETKLSALSGGTRQKVNIVQALMFDCPVLILDEPTNGLDPVALIQFKELIREERTKGKTILLTTHIMHLVDEIADQLVFILDGKVHFDGPVSILKKKYREADLEVAIAALLQNKVPMPSDEIGIDVNGHAVPVYTEAVQI